MSKVLVVLENGTISIEQKESLLVAFSYHMKMDFLGTESSTSSSRNDEFYKTSNVDAWNHVSDGSVKELLSNSEQ